MIRSAEGSPKTLQINPQQAFTPDVNEYYAWFYEGSQFWTLVGGVGMVSHTHFSRTPIRSSPRRFSGDPTKG